MLPQSNRIIEQAQKTISVLIATFKVPLLELQSVTPNYHNKWIEFAG
jgi:hypothetical protein